MADMDQGIKRLLQARPADGLTLALPGIQYLEPLPTQVAAEPQLELDTLFRARYEGDECAVDIEAQTYPDPEMPWRCFRYGSRASIVHRLPVLSGVLWLQPRGPIPSSPYVMRVGSWRQAVWEIINIEVYRLVASEVVASGALGLLPLVPFMSGADMPVIERAAAAIRDQAPARDLAGDLAALLGVFMARFHGQEAALALVRRTFVSTDLLEESPLYRMWRAEAEAAGRAKGEAEGRAKGEAEGRAKGEAEGRVEGRAEGMRQATRAALEGRFGTLDAELLALLDAAGEAELLAVLAHVASETLDQVRARLRPTDGQAG